ncbi:MAG: type VI secretion system protein TssA [Terracidiphilus sp.]
MPLRDEILAPIPGENPCGADLRYDSKLLIFDQIKEARRQDDDLSQGAWQTERKAANWPLVIKLAQSTLTATSKDLQLAAYLTEALLQTKGFDGLRQGLEIVSDLLTVFWDTIHPVIEDADFELRAKPLDWINLSLELPIRLTPLVGAGYSDFQYKQSREVGFEDQAKTDKERKDRKARIDAGKLAPEIFDRAFAETPKTFYLESEKALDASLELLSTLGTYCEEKFADDAPSFNRIRTAVSDVRKTVHLLLEKKREKEPDPVEPPPAEPTALVEENGNPIEAHTRAVGAAAFTAEPADLNQAMNGIVAAAAYLRKRDPRSPAPYLLLRGLRWGELRGVAQLADSPLLEAPPTELRQQIKRLSITKKWSQLLEEGERALAHPGSRAWLDLQRLSVTACMALGADYTAIAAAIQSELRALLNDLPELLDATLLDDTPAANPETKEWLRGLSLGARAAAKETDSAEELRSMRNGNSWLAPSVDAYVLAKDALASGQEEKAFAIMGAEVAKQRSGRRRFRRMMETIELAMSAGKDGIAQPLLEDIAASIETHKLDAWEEPELIASDLTKLMRYSKKIQGNAAEKQKLFERICRLDPVQALNVG